MIGIKTLLLRLTGFDALAELFVMEEVLKKKAESVLFLQYHTLCTLRSFIIMSSMTIPSGSYG